MLSELKQYIIETIIPKLSNLEANIENINIENIKERTFQVEENISKIFEKINLIQIDIAIVKQKFEDFKPPCKEHAKKINITEKILIGMGIIGLIILIIVFPELAKHIKLGGL